jgi:L-rhamnonate dehydratase
MRITDVRALQPIAENSPADWRTSMGQILVAVDTDAGLTGYGVGGGGLAGLHVVRTVLRDLLLGRSPEPVEALCEEMFAATLPFGQKGLAIMAVSGVDLALWDLRGQVERKPIAELLGGKVGQPIPTYATVWDEIPPEMADQHQAFKLHIPPVDPQDRTQDAVERVERARGVIGYDRELMIDCWMNWDLTGTLTAARELEPFQLRWIEEPLPVNELAGYAKLASESPIPIAGGEHEFTADGFRPWIENRWHQVLQPDICWCGGMTEMVKIYRMAAVAGLEVCPHRGAELWGLHAIAGLSPKPLAESGRPWMTWVGGQPPIEDGHITLSNAPGFGVIIDEGGLPMAF